MNIEEAIENIYNGNLIDCTRKEYKTEIRKSLQIKAGTLIDNGDIIRAVIFLEEVKRLDKKHDFC